MDEGDIFKVKELDGTYGFYRFIRYSEGDNVIGERKDISSLKSARWADVDLASVKELFEAYELVCQRLKDLEAARQTLSREFIELVNDAQAHLRSPF